jgi:hypothetical protein
MRLRKLSDEPHDCYPTECPAVFAVEDSDAYVVVGGHLLRPVAEAGVGRGEAAVRIPRDVLESAFRNLGWKQPS